MVYDNIDQDLVNTLIGNGRASLRSIADELDVSITTVSNHLSDLEEEGVIEGYTPIVNYEKLGYDVTAVLQLKVEGDALVNVTERLRDHDQMVSVYEVTGEFDVIALGKFTDTGDMNDLIKTVLSDADIKESTTSVVLNAPAEAEQFELDVE